MAKYLANELNEAEKIDFEQKLAANDDLNEEFRLALNAWHSVENSDNQGFDVEKAWGKVAQSTEKNLTRTIPLASRRRFTFLKIAATLIIVLTTGYFLSDYTGVIEREPTSIMHVASTEFKEITLPDGSSIKLKANSTLSYEEGFGDMHRSVELSGGADFDVQRNEALPFVIRTDRSAVKVLGTSFDLSAYPNQSVELNVREGLVNFTSASNEDQINEVAAGTRAILDKKAESISTQEMTNDNYAAWWTGKLVFENTPIAEVAKDLENTYSISIELKGDIRNCPLTATYSNKSLTEIVELIQLTFTDSDIKATYSKENTLILDGKACTN